jgi:hypothetical protein
MMGADTYDAVYIAKNAIERAGSVDKNDVRDALETTDMPQSLLVMENERITFSTGTNYHEILVKTFIEDLRQYWKDRPFIWSECEDVSLRKVRLPQCGRVLVLGPHPDDPESVAITCRLLMQSGCDIWYAIVSLSPSGVEDEYAQRRRNGDSVSLQELKCKIRQKEQTQSAEMFGLIPDRLAFLGIEEARSSILLRTWPGSGTIWNL